MKLIHLKSLIISIIVIAGIVFSQSAAGAVEVKLIKPEKFVDADMANQSRSKSFKEVQMDLEKLFNNVAKDFMTKDQSLLIEVLQLDLPGRIDYMSFGREVRIVREASDFYRLKFRYEIKEADGSVKKKGIKQFKDFLDRQSSRWTKSSSVTMDYLVKDLEEWFQSEFN